MSEDLIRQMLQRISELEKKLDKSKVVEDSAGISSASGVSSGTGTTKMNGATNRDNVGWLTVIDSAGNTVYVPYWTVITG